MSDQEEGESVEKDFAVEIATQGRATCKKCKEKCLKDEMRLAKLVHNPFATGKMKSWHHVECLFEVFLKQRPTTKRILYADDIDGFTSLPSNFQDQLLDRIKKSNEDMANKYGDKAKIPEEKSPRIPTLTKLSSTSSNEPKPYSFKEFRKLIAQITNVSSYLEKTQIVSDLFKSNFEGDIHLWCKLLLPGVVKRIYNLQSKQLVKIFSRILKTDQNKMLRHLEQGDIGETIQHFFESSLAIKPVKKSNLTVEEVDEFLEELSKLSKEEEQAAHFESIMSKCTSNDLKIIIRLIKHDLRMNAGAKHILEGVHPDAYKAYQSSRDLKSIIQKCLSSKGKPFNSVKGVSSSISLMTPVLPMLAEACKSVEMAMRKCPNGFYSEIKYDGERVQVHKKGSDFKYFSRSLKPVLQHKISHFKEHIPHAFPSGNDLILDSEILMIDKETQAPLPFGSLGKHKKNEYENACVCLYVFDCIYYNGEDLTNKPLQYRKKILKENMTEVKNHVVFSESKVIHKPSDLREMMVKVFQLGLEGLVLKDLLSIYEPGKRHWLKVKKDYLFDGAMADSADLIVLGAWYGTGKKGGKMSVFLMGCYDERRDNFCTVTKVHTGIDDKTLDELQEQLEMIKISSNPNKVPDWLSCERSMVPDFLAKDPKKQPVWEITGAEFTQHNVHTAEGISIRFPRVTKFRDDKNWRTATSLKELKTLFENSKEHTDFTLLMKEGKKGSLKNDEEIDEDLAAGTSSNDTTPSSKKGKDDDTNSIPDEDSPSTSKIALSKNQRTRSPRKRKLSNSEETSVSKKPYSPSYFNGVKLFLEEESKAKFKGFSEDFTTHGGALLKEKDLDKVTHVLHLNKFVKDINREYPYHARHVTLNWIEDSIKYECLQETQFYSVKWRTDL